MNRLPRLLCPECGRRAELKSSEVVYGTDKYGKMWVCPGYPMCTCYVGCRRGTDEPLGTLANAITRSRRKVAHAVFDRLWKNSKYGLDRVGAYTWMQDAMNLPKHKAHIAMMDGEQCADLVNKVYDRKREKPKEEFRLEPEVADSAVSTVIEEELREHPDDYKDITFE